MATSSKDNAALPIEAICIVGNLPQGWKDETRRSEDERSLAIYRIRVVTYDELIDNAYIAYGRFLAASVSGNRLRKLMEQIRAFDPSAPDPNATT